MLLGRMGMYALCRWVGGGTLTMMQSDIQEIGRDEGNWTEYNLGKQILRSKHISSLIDLCSREVLDTHSEQDKSSESRWRYMAESESGQHRKITNENKAIDLDVILMSINL